MVVDATGVTEPSLANNNANNQTLGPIDTEGLASGSNKLFFDGL